MRDFLKWLDCVDHEDLQCALFAVLIFGLSGALVALALIIEYAFS